MTSSASASIKPADEHAIRELVAAAQVAQSDQPTLLALHTPGVVIVNLAGRRVLGHDAFSAAMAGALASPLRDVLTTVEVIDIRPVSPDAAIVSCLKTVHDGRAAAVSDLPVTGALSYVVTRVDGSWLIAFAQTTPIVEAGAGRAAGSER